MSSYQVLSAYYDRFTEDVGYAAWADFFEEIFRREGVRPKLVLDLACGTGSMTAELARRGYEMIGADASEDMLMQAMSHAYDLSPQPMFLHQRMEELDLYGTIDACVCCLDSINYLTEPELVRRMLARIHLFLEPGGLLIFDINTPKKYADLSGQSFVREDGDVFCVWQYLVENDVCTYDFDIFRTGDGKRWTRAQETHTQRIYEPDSLRKWLEETGFTEIKQYPELAFGTLTGQEHRIFFSARKKEMKP